jgi:High-affinity nickel-transport protein.
MTGTLWTLWIGGLLGLLLGVRHALEPDHLVAISTLITEERDGFRAARLGASWGLGHTLSLLAAGVVLAVVRVEMPPGLAGVFELGVAVMLIGLGARALRMAWRLGAVGPDTVHSHESLVHHHPGVRDHVHVGGFTIARRPLIVGIVHGLAGSGALAALAMASLSSIAAQAAYIFVFGLGSTLGMALLSGCAGWPLARLARRPAALAWVSGVAGLLSIVVGIAWGGPLVWRWL